MIECSIEFYNLVIQKFIFMHVLDGIKLLYFVMIIKIKFRFILLTLLLWISLTNVHNGALTIQEQASYQSMLKTIPELNLSQRNNQIGWIMIQNILENPVNTFSATFQVRTAQQKTYLQLLHHQREKSLFKRHKHRKFINHSNLGNYLTILLVYHVPMLKSAY